MASPPLLCPQLQNLEASHCGDRSWSPRRGLTQHTPHPFSRAGPAALGLWAELGLARDLGQPACLISPPANTAPAFVKSCADLVLEASPRCPHLLSLCHFPPARPPFCTSNLPSSVWAAPPRPGASPSSGHLCNLTGSPGQPCGFTQVCFCASLCLPSKAKGPPPREGWGCHFRLTPGVQKGSKGPQDAQGPALGKVDRGEPYCWLQGWKGVEPLGPPVKTHTCSAPAGLSLPCWLWPYSEGGPCPMWSLRPVLRHGAAWPFLSPWCHCLRAHRVLSDSPASCGCVGRTRCTNHVPRRKRPCLTPGSGRSLMRQGPRTSSHPPSALPASGQAGAPQGVPQVPELGTP